MLPLNDLADNVIAQVIAGLGGSINHNLSKEQIKDDIVLMRARAAGEMLAQRRLDPQSLEQHIDALPCEKGELKKEEVLQGSMPLLLELPGLDNLSYFGVDDYSQPYKRMHPQISRFRDWDRFTSHRPTVVINNGKFWVYNPTSTNVKKLACTGIFANPRDLMPYGYTDDKPFPMPNDMADMIVGKIVNQYFRHNGMISNEPGRNKTT